MSSRVRVTSNNPNPLSFYFLLSFLQTLLHIHSSISLSLSLSFSDIYVNACTSEDPNWKAKTKARRERSKPICSQQSVVSSQSVDSASFVSSGSESMSILVVDCSALDKAN